MPGKTIAIVTIKDDIHAHAVRHELLSSTNINCQILEVDRLSSTHHISWRMVDQRAQATITASNGERLPLDAIDLVWWRRSRSKQIFDGKWYEPDHEDVINNDCRSSFLGAFLTSFKGKWISHPGATERAGNKLYQLSIAKQNGFRVPKTLVSQCPKDVRKFCESNQHGTIVKPVAGGTSGLLLFTKFITKELLDNDESIKVCPAIYQEYVPGTKHIRLNCFGDTSYAAIIESEELDWRPNLNVPVYAWNVPKRLHNKIRRILDFLELEIGIVDLKIDLSGTIFWLEVNPQGQFLFLEPMTKIPLTKFFCDYLISQVKRK